MGPEEIDLASLTRGSSDRPVVGLVNRLLVEAYRRGILLATGAGGLRVLRVQHEGARPVGAADYLHAPPLAVSAPRTSRRA